MAGRQSRPSKDIDLTVAALGAATRHSAGMGCMFQRPS
jgi:hypothetical protein